MRVDGGFEVDEVPGSEVFSWGVEGDQFQAGEAGEDVGDFVGSVVAFAEREALGVRSDEEGVECGEAGAVGDCVAVQQGGEDLLEAGGRGGREAGVDVGHLVQLRCGQNWTGLDWTSREGVPCLLAGSGGPPSAPLR